MVRGGGGIDMPGREEVGRGLVGGGGGNGYDSRVME